MTEPPASPHLIVGVILAAGSSSRLGTPKQLLPLGERPVLAHTLHNALSSKLDQVLVVLGHEATVIQEQITFTPATVILNPDYQSGQSSSLRVGLAAVPPTTTAVVFLLGDQPLISPAIIDALIDTYCATNAPIVQPTYQGQRGNPVLIARSLFPELAALTGDQGARGVVRAHAAAVQTVPIPGDPPTDDLDTADDYARLRERYASRQRQA